MYEILTGRGKSYGAVYLYFSHILIRQDFVISNFDPKFVVQCNIYHFENRFSGVRPLKYIYNIRFLALGLGMGDHRPKTIYLLNLFVNTFSWSAQPSKTGNVI